MSILNSFPMQPPEYPIMGLVNPPYDGRVSVYTKNATLLANNGRIYGEHGREALSHIIGYVSTIPCLQALPEDHVYQVLTYDEFLLPEGCSPVHPFAEMVFKSTSEGVPLKRDKIPSAMTLGENAPKMFFYLMEAISILVTLEKVGSFHQVEIYTWPGGKNHYKNNPQDAQALKDLVDMEAYKNQRNSPPIHHAPPPEPQKSVLDQAPLTRSEQILKEAGLYKRQGTEAKIFEPSGNLLKDLRNLGFESMGTPDMGHIMQISRNGMVLQACRGNAPTLARSTLYTLRVFDEDMTLVYEAVDLDARAAAYRANEILNNSEFSPKQPAP